MRGCFFHRDGTNYNEMDNNNVGGNEDGKTRGQMIIAIGYESDL